MINSNPSFASMADQCIVCLEDLDIAHPITTATELPDQDHAGPSTASIITTNITQPGKLDDDDNNGNGNEIAETQLLALIKPCGHVLHDECLREWSQKANSCPICRRAFNLVEVLDGVGGKIFYSTSFRLDLFWVSLIALLFAIQSLLLVSRFYEITSSANCFRLRSSAWSHSGSILRLDL